MSAAKVEQQSTETLSFRCWCERCRLTRGRRVKQSRATELGWGEGSTFNSATVEQLQKPNDETSPVARFRNKFGMTSDFCCLTRGRRMKQKRAAFTLAEVLITLGIIGVVAALTLPTLITNYREKQRVIQLKKTYSTLQQAFVRAQEAHGELQYWDLAVTDTGEVDENGQKILDYSGEEKVLSYLGEFLDTSENNSDFKTTIQKLNGSYAYKVVHYAKQYLKLKDGTIVAMGYVSKGNSSDIIIYYDGCDKKACRIGVNSFFFKLKPKIGLQPLGLPTDTLHSFGGQCNLGQNVTYMNGRGCTAWVIYKENMDYLHCNDLSWNGKSKCKQ